MEIIYYNNELETLKNTKIQKLNKKKLNYLLLT